jgi:hypothetical protein
LEFYTNKPNGGQTVNMVLRGDGKVGIGTTSPGAKLDVQDASNNLTNIFNTNLNYGTGVSGDYTANTMAASYGTSSGGKLTGLQVTANHAGTSTVTGLKVIANQTGTGPVTIASFTAGATNVVIGRDKTGWGGSFLGLQNSKGLVFDVNATKDKLITEIGANFTTNSNDGVTRYAVDGTKRAPFIQFDAEAGSISLYGESGTTASGMRVLSTLNQGLTVKSDGKVGVGVSAPGVKLDVSGDHVPGQGIIRANGTTHALIVANAFNNSNLSGFRLSSGGATMWDIAQNENVNGNNLTFSSAAKPQAMTISQSTGNVGIGRAPSVFKLDVNGSARLSGGGLVLDGDGQMITNNYGTADVSNPTAVNDFFRIFMDGQAANNGALHIQSGDDGAEPIVFEQVNANTTYTRMMISSGGNVGIGNKFRNVNPTEALEVDGNIKASGGIEVASVKTKVWSIAPDYVFENGYDLKPLAHVDRYVQEHKHLPEIPSAKEISEKGIDLAEMNMKLLRKVEELTLYSIKQEKKIDNLTKRMESMEQAK